MNVPIFFMTLSTFIGGMGLVGTFVEYRNLQQSGSLYPWLVAGFYGGLFAWGAISIAATVYTHRRGNV